MVDQEKYDRLHGGLARIYNCSPRIIQYIRSSYYQKYKGEDLVKVKKEILNHCDKVLIETMRTYRQVKIEFASLVLRDIKGIKNAERHAIHLKTGVKHMVGFTDKIGFRKSLIDFLKHCSDAEFRAIINVKMTEEESNALPILATNL